MRSFIRYRAGCSEPLARKAKGVTLSSRASDGTYLNVYIAADGRSGLGVRCASSLLGASSGMPAAPEANYGGVLAHLPHDGAARPQLRLQRGLSAAAQRSRGIPSSTVSPRR